MTMMVMTMTIVVVVVVVRHVGDDKMVVIMVY